MSHRAARLALAAGWGLAVGLARADITGICEPGVYVYEVTSLPDFDQHRKMLTGVRLGLPGDGVAYCVPTSSTDLLAYAANHGFPEIAPGPGYWQSNTLYDAAESFIAALGQKMSTHPSGGTIRAFWYFGLVGNPFLDIPPSVPVDRITVTAQFMKGSFVPRFSQMTKSAIGNNGLVAFCHGWYDVIGSFSGVPIVTRDNGHSMALQRSASTPGGAIARFRDPAWDECNLGACNEYFQSTFAGNIHTVEPDTVYFDVPFIPHDVSSILPAAPGEMRILDGYVMLSTKGGYSFTDDLQFITFVKPVMFLGSTPPVSLTIPILDGVGDLVDAVAAPDLDAFTYIAGVRVYDVDMLTGETSVVTAGDPVLPTKLVYGRNRMLYVLDDPQVIAIDMDAEPEPVAEMIAYPPSPCDLIAFDDRTDTVWLVSSTAGEIYTYPDHLDDVPQAYTIPAQVPLAGDLALAASPLDSSLWLLNATAATLCVLVVDPDGAVQAECHAVPEGVVAESLDVDDTGHLLVAGGGVVRELAVDGGVLTPVPGLFDAVPAHGIFRVTKSRTNYDDAVHGGPEWGDRFPEVFGEGEADCLADFVPADGDGIVGIQEFLELLSLWGPCPACPADIDPPGGDDLVGIQDFLTLLAAWGPCP